MKETLLHVKEIVLFISRKHTLLSEEKFNLSSARKRGIITLSYVKYKDEK